MTMRLVIVTGGRSELAMAVAARAAAAGHRVILVTRGERPPEWRAMEPDIRSEGGVDLAKPDGIATLRQLVDEVSTATTIDLMNCLGEFGGFAALGDLSIDALRSAVEGNLIAAHGAVLACLPRMLQVARGTLLLVGSHAALGQFPMMGGFLTAKTALESYARTFASEYSPLGLRALCVAPATIDTLRERELRQNADRTGWLSPIEVADCLLELCSSGLTLLNGSTVQLFRGSHTYHSTAFLDRIGSSRESYPGFRRTSVEIER